MICLALLASSRRNLFGFRPENSLFIEIMKGQFSNMHDASMLDGSSSISWSGTVWRASKQPCIRSPAPELASNAGRNPGNPESGNGFGEDAYSGGKRWVGQMNNISWKNDARGLPQALGRALEDITGARVHTMALTAYFPASPALDSLVV